MKEKIKGNIFFYWGLTIFISIGACILLYFICLRIDEILNVFYSIIHSLMPILLGILFAYLLSPFVEFLENKVYKRLSPKIKKHIKCEKKFNRVMSIFTTYLIAALLIFLFIKFVIPNLLESMEMMMKNIPLYINNVYEYLKGILKNNPELAIMVDNLNENITNSLTNVMIPSLDTILMNLTNGIQTVIKALINFIIALIVSVYLIYDKENFIRGIKKVCKSILPNKMYNSLLIATNYVDKIFGGFMIAKIIDSLIIGILTFIIISIFRIPYALIISVIVGVTNIIPYFGPFIGAIPSAVLLLLIDPKKALTFIILIFLIQQFDGNILGPKLIGNKTGIKSFWVLFSILLFGGLFGFVGMIFGVPIFAIIYSLLTVVVNKKLEKKIS